MAMSIACFVLLLVVATSLADECPGAIGSNWVVGKGRCYRYVSRAMSWRSAQKYCSSLGFAGGLAFLDSDQASASARKAVQSSVGTSGAPDWMWIGITDEGNEGVWKSVDGVKVEKPNFRVGQPDNAGGREHYVHIHGKDWNWNDVPEANKYPFICQAEPFFPFQSKCPMHWESRGGLCYKYIDTPLNWYDAQQRCSIMGSEGSLAYVGSKNDNDNIFELPGANGDFWLGLADLRHEGQWSSPFGKSAPYLNWRPNEPNDLSGEDCVHMTGNRQWNDLDCGANKRPFVCQRSPVFSANRCPPEDGWVQRGDSCYRYFLKRGSWNAALLECRSQGRGGTLPFVNSKVQNDVVYQAAALSAGGEYRDNFKNFWMGVTDKGHAGKWTGPDNVGQLGSFSAWAPGEPNNLLNEYYVEMLVGSQKWNDEDGDEDAFVCQIPAIRDTVPDCGCPICPEPEPCPTCVDCPQIFCPEPRCAACEPPIPCEPCEPCAVPSCVEPTCPPWPECPPCIEPLIFCPPEPQTSCPPLWSEYQGSCYKFGVKKLSWADAKAKCSEEEASLADIGKTNMGFLADYIAMFTGGVKGKKTYAWVDLNDQEKEGVFIDSDGDVYGGEVNAKKQKKKKDCAMYKRNDLSHEKCGAKHVFVCKKPADLILA